MYKRSAFGALESFSLPERVMNQKQIQVKFRDQVQVLDFKKRQLVSNLLAVISKTFHCTKENRSIRKGDETKKETCKGNLQGKVFDWYLRDKRTLRRNFGRRIVARCGVRRICQEACYGCSHLKTDERQKALCDVGCLDLVREWYDCVG